MIEYPKGPPTNLNLEPVSAEFEPSLRRIHTRKILIVDDDSELREALVEQLALHEEFLAPSDGWQSVCGTP